MNDQVLTNEKRTFLTMRLGRTLASGARRETGFNFASDPSSDDERAAFSFLTVLGSPADSVEVKLVENAGRVGSAVEVDATLGRELLR